MIRILHVLNNLSISNGIANVIINYLRVIDRNQVNFDFLIYENQSDLSFENEIRRFGCRIFYMPKLNVFNFVAFIKYLNCFFKKNSEIYKAIHLHEHVIGSLVFYIAKKYGVVNRILHSHNPALSDSYIKSLRNSILCIGLIGSATKFLSCSYESGHFLFGDKICKSDNFRILYNAIDFKKYWI